MNVLRPYILVAVIVLIASSIYLINRSSVRRTGSDESVPVVPRISSEQQGMKKEEKSERYEVAKEITSPDGFINTDGITISSLIGKKVILVDFWTYSCINCQRTTQYLNAWYEKYKDKGFVIIGMHTPEFEFEKDYNNVTSAVKKFGIQFPVVLDNDYSTWTAYKNRYWPHKYLIDIDGYIAYDHIGEGAYEETEKKIQELLEERTMALGMDEEINRDISVPTGITQVNSSMIRSPETYFGAARNSNLGNGEANTVGLQNLSLPVNTKTNTLYLSGEWDFQDEFAENKNAQAKITFRYQAQNVYFVAGSKNTTNISIMKDGKFIGERAIREHTLYHVIEDSEYGEHTLEIIIENPGLRAFTFTFG
ncbi:MAG: Thiol-disulfide isomerase [Parcubacteria group bacterium Gr01-1014_48]|nr:MAG: Thiol-disulfide isomerase [Parcubacteria group bacterium Greene0416_14]TSC73941.1 MAG: Thiol-disulfide isomerase [Parcubacteria group bacterium Gr01-1014_48]TSD00942.1 MAG: Thiol-disulfide isomerase [Parcubacteria group bacterium Greene1014_15]TSD07894.1 MAG: Thiol-disulfide isomerase [Parcubacteria group bacterium Greene0714_4]